MDRGVLAVDGDDRRPGPLGQPHHERPGHHERLLVGQRHGATGGDGGPRAAQAGRSDDGGDHAIDRGVGHELVEGLVADRQPGSRRQARRIDRRSRVRIDDHHPGGPEPVGLLEQRPDALPRGEQMGHEPPRGGRDHVERAAADAARRAEDGDAHELIRRRPAGLGRS